MQLAAADRGRQGDTLHNLPGSRGNGCVEHIDSDALLALRGVAVGHLNDAGKSNGSKLPSDKWGILGNIRPLLLVRHIFGEHTTGQYILSLNRHQI